MVGLTWIEYSYSINHRRIIWSSIRVMWVRTNLWSLNSRWMMPSWIEKWGCLTIIPYELHRGLIFNLKFRQHREKRWQMSLKKRRRALWLKDKQGLVGLKWMPKRIITPIYGLQGRKYWNQTMMFWCFPALSSSRMQELLLWEVRWTLIQPMII